MPLFCLLILIVSSFASVVFQSLQTDEADEKDHPIPAESCAISGVEFKVLPSWVHVGEPVKFYANATTDVGSSLNFTIKYDSELPDGSPNPNSPVSVNVTASVGKVVTTWTYDHEGNLTDPLVEDPFFKVTLTIFDGFTTKTQTRLVYVVPENVAPKFVLSLGSHYEPTVMECVYSIKLIDQDGDPLNVTWDFGDGTPLVYNETGPAGTEVTVNQTHVWDPIEPGAEFYEVLYYLNVTVNDGQGNVIESTSEVLFKIGLNLGPEGMFSASAKWVDPTVEVWFYANASDREGEAITWTFVFEREAEEYHTEVHRTNVTEPNAVVWMNVSHVFSMEGNYSVTLYITDAALPELQVDRHNQTLGPINITSEINVVPYVMNAILVTFSAPEINSTNPTVTATLYTEVADWDGDVLTATWDFGDGSDSSENTTSGGKKIHGISQEHEFSAAGYFNVTLKVTDGWYNHTVTRWEVITIRSDNKAPTIVGIDVLHTNGSYSLPGSIVGFIIKFFDEENDPIEITWDFGDNSTVLRLNLTDYDEKGVVICEVNHTYELRGEYKALVTFTDRMFDTKYHNGSVNITVRIRYYGIAEIEEWNIWDYVGLGILFALIGSVVAWVMFADARRKKIDQWGLTWDEYRIRKKEVKLGDLRSDGKFGPGGGGT
ncbi:MAG: PKD domain-containing protein [Thermoplasmata archaeon]|nr:PKD domain-containing protein [Thermoplasmata archaeon]